MRKERKVKQKIFDLKIITQIFDNLNKKPQTVTKLFDLFFYQFFRVFFFWFVYYFRVQVAHFYDCLYIWVCYYYYKSENLNKLRIIMWNEFLISGEVKKSFFFEVFGAIQHIKLNEFKFVWNRVMLKATFDEWLIG